MADAVSDKDEYGALDFDVSCLARALPLHLKGLVFHNLAHSEPELYLALRQANAEGRITKFGFIRKPTRQLRKAAFEARLLNLDAHWHMRHWLGAQDSLGSGNYPRSTPNQSAKLAYNRLQNSGSIIWLNAIFGVDQEKLTQAADAILDISDHRQKCGVLRKYLPWQELALQIRAYYTKKLTVFGVGPWLVGSIIVITVLASWANLAGLLAGGSFAAINWLHYCAQILGVGLAIIGLVFWAIAVIGQRIVSKIKSNALVTSGVYGWVRHPIYSAFFMLCSGVLIFQANWWLLALPLLCWALLTIVLKRTEERWLTMYFGHAYVEYSSVVNRCIPWPPRQIASSNQEQDADQP